MHKWVCCILLLLSGSVSAQMVDIMSNLAIQGTLTQQSAGAVNSGLSRAKQTQILNDISQTVMEVKMARPNDYYTGISKNSLMTSPFSGLNWNLGSETQNTFFIQLNQLDKSTCSYLTGRSLGAERMLVNGQPGSCRDQNNLKLIFR